MSSVTIATLTPPDESTSALTKRRDCMPLDFCGEGDPASTTGSAGVISTMPVPASRQPPVVCPAGSAADTRQVESKQSDNASTCAELGKCNVGSLSPVVSSRVTQFACASPRMAGSICRVARAAGPTGQAQSRESGVRSKATARLSSVREPCVACSHECRRCA